MKLLIALVAILVASTSLADEKSHELDRKIIGLLLGDAEVVLLGHKDASGMVGMDARLKRRYGLVNVDTAISLVVKDTLIGPKITQEKIAFSCNHGADNDPFFLAEGDYLVFLKHDAQKRWILVGDFMGLQPLAKGLDALVKEVHGK